MNLKRITGSLTFRINLTLFIVIGILAFVGLFIHPKTAVISCCYLVPVTLFYIYVAPFWYTLKRRWQEKHAA